MDSFKNLSDSPDFSARKLVAVTPHNSNDLAYTTKALFIGTGGNIVVLAEDDTVAVTLKVTDGQILPVRAKRVLETNTTATGIVGMY